MTVSFPNFSLFSDALMAALASRSHDWKYWEITEAIVFRLTGPTTREIVLRDGLSKYLVHCGIQTPDSSWRETQCELSQKPSPSLTLEALLAGTQDSQNPILNSYKHAPMRFLQECLHQKPTIFDSHENVELSEHWRTLTVDTSVQEFRFLQFKNSNGQYRQALYPIF
jgi:hypothetical protein